ncbi:MAG: GNAT family N-acetyltransferase [Novosphingobium sp.]|nr:GNAT family N-acetyltransferase [Novosphingobium sp.]
MSLVLRPATPADAAAVAALGRAGFTAAFGHLYQPENLAAFLADSHAEEVTRAQIDNPALRTMLAERDGALVGFCKLVLACGWPELARGHHAIELKQLYTAPDTTGGGIGTSLMGWALAEARAAGADEVQLSVWCGNTGAQRFYARHGFAKVGDVEFHVGSQVDHEFLFARLL